MNLHCIHIHADRREHQYRILIPHKPAKQPAAQRCPSRLQHSFLAAARPGHIDADPLSEPHFLFTTFLQGEALTTASGGNLVSERLNRYRGTAAVTPFRQYRLREKLSAQLTDEVEIRITDPFAQSSPLALGAREMLVSR